MIFRITKGVKELNFSFNAVFTIKNFFKVMLVAEKSQLVA